MIEEHSNCSICLNEINVSKCIFSCTHQFHYACITQWFTAEFKNPTCPLCRKSLKKNTEETLPKSLTHTLNREDNEFSVMSKQQLSNTLEKLKGRKLSETSWRQLTHKQGIVFNDSAVLTCGEFNILCAMNGCRANKNTILEEWYNFSSMA